MYFFVHFYSEDESGDEEDTDEAGSEDEEREEEEEDCNETINESSVANGDHDNSWVYFSNNKNDDLSDIFQNLSVTDKSPVCKTPKVEKILKMDKTQMDELAKNKEVESLCKN